MSGRGCGGWVAIAVLLSAAAGCDCNGGRRDPGGAGTTAGGAGMNAVEDDSGAGMGAGAGAMRDGAIGERDSASEPDDDDACRMISESWPHQDMLREPTKACLMMDSFDGWSSGVPNPADVAVRDEVMLTQPLAAHEPSAISMVLAGAETNARLEVWGASDDAMCGAVEQLLWFGDVEPRRVCMTFTPSIEVRRLRLVWRELEPRASFIARFAELTVCASGACPGGASGTGRDGEPLEVPLFDLRHYAPTNGFVMDEHGVAWELDGEGTYLALWDETSSNPHPLVSGLLHVPWDEELGDGWYCAGENSLLTISDEDPKRSHSSLRGLTRLPDCQPGDGTLTMATVGVKLEVTSSLSELDMTAADPLGGKCVDRTCDVYFVTMDGEGRHGFLILRLQADTPFLTAGSPFNMSTDLVSALVVMARDDGTALIACASGGVMGQDDAGLAKFELTGLSAPLRCPGDTLDTSWLDFTTGRPASSE